jgi:hypothetical protein
MSAWKTMFVAALLSAMAGLQGCQSQPEIAAAAATAPPSNRSSVASKEAESRAAFLAAYQVLMHPRCLNCHPAGDAPLQGDDSHPHFQNVQRGPDGKGLYAMKCANCHQWKNLPGEHMPPGHPEWHLPPLEMRMVFEGRTPAQLARQLKDPEQNGGKTLDEIVHHAAEDSLVATGWNPGDGRSKPPLTQAEFGKKMREWVEKGAAIPE